LIIRLYGTMVTLQPDLAALLRISPGIPVAAEPQIGQ
jgi:hypothetical protein